MPAVCQATAYYGGSFSVLAASKEPSPFHGCQLMLNYDPQMFQWRRFNVFFDGGISYFYQHQMPDNSNISIYSIAPVIRYTFKKRGPVSPYFDFSVGFAYLNHTRIENRNLGIHFAFQDRVGVGALLGGSERLSLGVHAVHYSNSHLSSRNSGITIPLLLDIGYRFS